MAKSWLGRFIGSWGGVDRRKEIAPAQNMPRPEDFDPLTGALRWERFIPLLEAEQAQTPGILLMIDLSETSRTMALAADQDDTVLPLLAQAIRQAIRHDDLLAHVEGYRFAAMLRGASLAQADTINARILESVEDTIFVTHGGIATLEVVTGRSVYPWTSTEEVIQSANATIGAG